MDSFWTGFEKNAGIPGLLGKAVGSSGRAAKAVVQGVKQIPGQLKQIPGQVKEKIVRNQREFDVMKRKGMGIEGRAKHNLESFTKGLASNPNSKFSPTSAGKQKLKPYNPKAQTNLDLSQKAKAGRLATGVQSPAAQAAEAKKNSLFNKFKTTAQVGAAAGATGIALGAQGMNEQAEQR